MVSLTLYAFASRTNPEFHWVEIGRSEEPGEAFGPYELDWIPSDRVWLVDPPNELRPADPSSSLSRSEMIRSDEPAGTLAHLKEFLRLPDRSQQILAHHGPGERPGVVAVCNAEPAGSAFPSNIVPSILDVHRRAGFSVMIGWGPEASTDRFLFDYVYRLDGLAESERSWKQSVLVCEKAGASKRSATLRGVSLGNIPLLAEVFSKVRFPGESGAFQGRV